MSIADPTDNPNDATIDNASSENAPWAHADIKLGFCASAGSAGSKVEKVDSPFFSSCFLEGASSSLSLALDFFLSLEERGLDPCPEDFLAECLRGE